MPTGIRPAHYSGPGLLTMRVARWLYWPARRFGINWLTIKLAKIAVWIADQAKFTNGR
jgi:hypothetical protein